MKKFGMTLGVVGVVLVVLALNTGPKVMGQPEGIGGACCILGGGIGQCFDFGSAQFCEDIGGVYQGRRNDLWRRLRFMLPCGRLLLEHRVHHCVRRTEGHLKRTRLKLHLRATTLPRRRGR